MILHNPLRCFFTLLLLLVLTVPSLATSGPHVESSLPPLTDRGFDLSEDKAVLWGGANNSIIQPDGIFTDNITLTKQMGGLTYNVTVSGSYAYIGSGPCLVILDISNPAQVTMVGQSDVLAGGVGNIAVAGDYAYVVGAGDLYVFAYICLT